MFRTNLVVHHHEHGIIYCITQFGTIGTIVQSSLQDFTNCAMQYSILCRAPDDERLDSFETCRADKKLWNKKLIIRIVRLVGH